MFMNGLRIALVLDRFESSLGGLENWTERLANWLVCRGHDVSVLCFAGTTKNSAVKLHIVDSEGGPLARAAAIAARLSRLSFDIIHDTGTAAQADVFQPQTGSRLVNAKFDLATRTPWRRLRISLSPAFRRWRHEMQTLERRQFADPSRVIAVSQMVRDQIASRYRLDPAGITVIHNGIDNKRFTADRLATLRAPARLKWSLGDAATFLLVANNFDLKGAGTALHALARLRGFASNIRLAIAGGGDVERYSRVANRLGIADQVDFLGKLDQIEEAYAAADVALQPTHYDACSLATLEGLASGLPTITTRSNGAAELITTGKQGIVLDHSSDAEALAKAMERLLEPDLRRGMGLAARALALQHDIDDNYRAVESFYRHALHRRTAGPPQVE
jgi:UDP-glucose:(heptosyl)LPS alpha-1,3-glucosyltransferase